MGRPRRAEERSCAPRPRGNPPQSRVLEAQYRISRIEAEEANERGTRLAAAEGLEYHLEKARPANTRDAHRILQLVSVRRIRPEVEERFQKAYLSEGVSVADPETLLRLAVEAGLSDGDVRRVLAGQAFAHQVRTDEEEAHALGARGVPFFTLDRERAISVARPVEVFRHALESSPARDGPDALVTGSFGSADRENRDPGSPLGRPGRDPWTTGEQPS